MLLGAVVPVQTRVTLAFAFIFFFLIVFSERADNDSPQNLPCPELQFGWDPVWEACGVEWTGCPGEKPCDDLDACCKIYDECVEKKSPGVGSQKIVSASLGEAGGAWSFGPIKRYMGDPRFPDSSLVDPDADPLEGSDALVGVAPLEGSSAKRTCWSWCRSARDGANLLDLLGNLQQWKPVEIWPPSIIVEEAFSTKINGGPAVPLSLISVDDLFHYGLNGGGPPLIYRGEIGISEVSESKQENVEDIIKNQQLDNQLKEIIVELRKNNEEIIKKLQETVQKSWEKVRTEFEKRSGFHAASIIQKAAQDSLEKNRKEAAQQLKTTPENETPKDTNDHEVVKRDTINQHILFRLDGGRPQG
ncbi:hypothetical protein EZV62_027587 [Acer yangbiense]|uniref:Uncharacterized protein n=1 Tax=Acer yangbiense TaxID=1000413 RepID=A0A5C7GUF3_9ROSI|nr:hypothetical protein EZV62_027587 [Acer yangbiense]